MMLAWHGRPSGVNVFDYHLALKLHKTVGEIQAMPHAEYTGWASYFTAKHAVESVHPVLGGGK